MKAARLVSRQVASPLPCQHFLMSPWLECAGGLGRGEPELTFPRPWGRGWGCFWWGGRKAVRGVTERKSLAHALNAVPLNTLAQAIQGQQGSEAAGETENQKGG